MSVVRNERAKLLAIAGAVIWLLMASVLNLAAQWEARTMTDIQWFGLVILPLAVGVVGCVAAWAGRHFIR